MQKEGKKKRGKGPTTVTTATTTKRVKNEKLIKETKSACNDFKVKSTGRGRGGRGREKSNLKKSELDSKKPTIQ